MITITNEMRAQRQQEVADLEAKMDARIIDAVKENENKAIFILRAEDNPAVYTILRHRYELAGYHFITIENADFLSNEYICW